MMTLVVALPATTVVYYNTVTVTSGRYAENLLGRSKLVAPTTG